MISIRLQTSSKKGFWAKIAAGANFRPQAYHLEDLKFASYKEFGPKNFFEMACNIMTAHTSERLSLC
ncbi:MAG: hypothetical protein M0036_21475 [Desulfobacteraceae bacterium]|nr:hypothetical protein [Desulfobacteraceae bacterium]